MTLFTTLDAKLKPRHLWLALAATAGLDLYATLYTAPTLAAMAGGAPILDLRIGGYDQRAAAAFLDALGPTGRRFHALWHSPADTMLALVEAVAIGLLTLWFTRPAARFSLRLHPWLRAGLLVLPLLTLVLDIGENAQVAGMLAAGGGVDGATVRLASLTTELKWLAAGISLLAVAALAVGALVAGRGRPPPRE